MKPTRPFRVATTSEAFNAGANSQCTLVGARLFGGSAASSAIVRETDGSGVVLAELQCAIGAADEFRIPVTFNRKIHVTLVGAGASCVVYVA